MTTAFDEALMTSLHTDVTTVCRRFEGHHRKVR